MEDSASSKTLPIVNVKALAATLTKKEVLDEKVQQSLSVLADDIIDDVVEFACKLARHRGSNTLQRGDVKLAFEKRFKLKVPSKLHQQSSNCAVLPQAVSSTSNYKQNLALVKKALDN